MIHEVLKRKVSIHTLTLTSTLFLGGGVEGGEEVGGWSAGLGTVNAGQLSILQLADILVCNGGVQLLDTGLEERGKRFRRLRQTAD